MTTDIYESDCENENECVKMIVFYPSLTCVLCVIIYGKNIISPAVPDLLQLSHTWVY